jgi:hypothetical protein
MDFQSPEGRNQNRSGRLRYATARPHLSAGSGYRKLPRRRLCGVGASALDRRPQDSRPHSNMLLAEHVSGVWTLA